MIAEYDVIVIGAGPAGSSAGKAAAERGLKTLILEEHPAIGIPRHCPGRLQGSSFTEEILADLDPSIVLTRYRLRRVYAPSGRLVQEFSIEGRGCCAVLRDEFDREVARQAARAGAEIRLNTRVTGFLREEGKVRGVVTTSRGLPKVYAKVVIAADGLRSILSGVAHQEALARPGEEPIPGILLELEGVKDLEPDVTELHLGAFGENRPRATLWPTRPTSAFIAFDSLAIFEEIRAGDYLLSQKIRDAVPIQMTGFAQSSGWGHALPRTVKDNLMLVGNAAGFTGIIHAIVSGRYAGEVAANSIREGDLSEGALMRYQEMCHRIGLHLTGRDGAALGKLSRLSDEAIEQLLPEMARKGELNYLDQLPF